MTSFSAGAGGAIIAASSDVGSSPAFGPVLAAATGTTSSGLRAGSGNTPEVNGRPPSAAGGAGDPAGSDALGAIALTSPSPVLARCAGAPRLPSGSCIGALGGPAAATRGSRRGEPAAAGRSPIEGANAIASRGCVLGTSFTGVASAVINGASLGSGRSPNL